MALSCIASLVLRIVTFAFIVSSLVIFLSNNESGEDDALVGFFVAYPYLYALACMFLGTIYTFVQIVRGIKQVIKRESLIGANTLIRFDFYGDKVTSYLLLSGATAMLVVTIELLDEVYSFRQFKTFYIKEFVSFSLLFVGFLGTVMSSVFSSYSPTQYRLTSIPDQ